MTTQMLAKEPGYYWSCEKSGNGKWHWVKKPIRNYQMELFKEEK